MLDKQIIKRDSIKKVISFGCSASDYMFGTNKVYGEVLANELGVHYYHHGVGCGSNHRMWRRFFKYAVNGKLNENTLITIQWTELTREEVFTRISSNIKYFQPVENEDYYEKGKNGTPDTCHHLDGLLFKYKWDEWNNKPYPINEYMKIKTDNMLSDKWSFELWKNWEFSIFDYCKNNNIPLVMMNSQNYNNYNIYKQEECYFNVVEYQDIFNSHPRIMENGEEDYAHMSTEGHEVLGNRILNKLEL